MQFYWVNHKKTFENEVGEGYLWSPKTKRNGDINWSYELMKQIKPGDIVFSYAHTKIQAIGYVTSRAYTSTKPVGFWEEWNSLGWKVDVNFETLPTPFHPKSYIDEIKPLLKEKYSPINSEGNGNQVCYLAQIAEKLAYYLFKKLNLVLELPEKQTTQGTDPIHTERLTTITQRVGQDKFRKKLLKMHDGYCQLTGTRITEILRASHIVPWSNSDNSSRLDPFNGLLLVSHVDALFDNGLISFSSDGSVMFANDEIKSFFKANNIPFNINNLHQNHEAYLEVHRDKIFQRAYP